MALAHYELHAWCLLMLGNRIFTWALVRWLEGSESEEWEIVRNVKQILRIVTTTEFPRIHPSIK